MAIYQGKDGLNRQFFKFCSVGPKEAIIDKNSPIFYNTDTLAKTS